MRHGVVISETWVIMGLIWRVGDIGLIQSRRTWGIIIHQTQNGSIVLSAK